MSIIIGQDRVQLTSPFNSGGSAMVYAHPLRHDQCVKIYTKPDEVEPERIRFLVANPPPQLRAGGVLQFAWPLAPAYDEQTGRMVGFSMPRLQRVLPVTAIVDPGSCSAAITREFRWKVAINIARLVHTLHLMSPAHIMGDVNLENFLVHRNGRVTAIDLDSTYFCVAGSPPFRCRRHRPEMQPPELVSANASVVDRGQDQDAFSVFIKVHRLIREGIHPFDACFAGSGAPLRLHERIERRIWPDSLHHADYRPKDGSVPFTSLPAPLQDLFRRMFDEGAKDRAKRPDVTELLTALELHRPIGVPFARVGRHAWRRELHPDLGAQSKLRSLAEVCHGHRYKALTAAALTASVIGGAAISGYTSTPTDYRSKLSPQFGISLPGVVPPPAPKPQTKRYGRISPHARQLRLQPSQQQGLPAPDLWRLAEEATR